MATSRQPNAMAGSGNAVGHAGANYTFDTWTIVLGLFATGNLANGVWMLADPGHWYENLPAGVPDFGPLNEHFVRDIGCIFFLLGVALAWAAVMPRWRVAACALVTGFYGLHALVHVIDTARGLVGPEHWVIDLSGVYVPAVIMAVLTWRVARSRT
jgi:hypothetical protein